ncbi:hypothetical protein [Ochrovirga pacifica]|uniref:hypothetical protein n=1 Tax=Ochrovirga pacifica TaxID=1042376 RepID=UPI001112AE77|nr:hypothetical protein [Ochrovirga pacifica]
MKRPITLYHCPNKLDVLYLKNKIQLITPIPVVIYKKEANYHLVVSFYNARKANVVVSNCLATLPSVIKHRMQERIEQVANPDVSLAGSLTLKVKRFAFKLSMYLENLSTQNLHFVN